jgi:hypothetical protein
MGIVTKPPIGSLCLQALGFITRERWDAAATRRAYFLGERLGHILVLEPIIKATAGVGLSIDLPEHDIERADDRRDIGKHVPAGKEVHRLQMGE